MDFNGNQNDLSSELSLKPELTFTESDTHSTPATGQVKIYAKLDGNMYKKNDQGVESGIGGGGSADLTPIQNISATPGNTIITGDLEVGGEDDFLVACGIGTYTLLYSSDSGSTWTGAVKTVLTTSAQDATFGNNTWVAVGSGGGTTIAQSSDGITWTGVAYPFTAAYGVGFGNNLFVALGNTTFGNSIVTSPDGITWTGRGNSIFTNYGTAAKYANNMWVAGGSGSNCLAHSFDGINWVGIGSVVIMANCFDVIHDGTRWIAVGSGGQNTILTSPDGITWTGLGYLNSNSSIAYDGSTYVIASDVGLEYSTDLLNWTTSTSSVGVGKSVSWTGDKFVATGTSGDIQTSTDGVNWITVSTGLYSVGYGLGVKSSTPPTLEITPTEMKVNSNLSITGQIVHEVSKNNTFASNTFNFNCDTSMTQTVLGEGMTGNGNITFSNEQEGTTYIIIFTQGSGTYNVSLPSGYWLNDEVYNFSTLIVGAKAIITAVYIDGSWIFSAKGLLSV